MTAVARQGVADGSRAAESARRFGPTVELYDEILRLVTRARQELRDDLAEARGAQVPGPRDSYTGVVDAAWRLAEREVGRRLEVRREPRSA